MTYFLFFTVADISPQSGSVGRTEIPWALVKFVDPRASSFLEGLEGFWKVDNGHWVVFI